MKVCNGASHAAAHQAGGHPQFLGRKDVALQTVPYKQHLVWGGAYRLERSKKRLFGWFDGPDLC